MSKAKHTPGPWSVSERLGFGWLIHPNVAVAYGGEGSGKQDEGEHNAHLIAAAPEMLATLRKLEYWLDTDPEVIEAMPGDERRDHMAKLGMIREVIAKAEGQS